MVETNKMKSANKAFITILSAVLLLSVILLTASCSSNVDKAFDSVDKRIELYVTAYEALIKSLSEAKLLPDFESVELVEESLSAYLNENNLQALADKLDGLHSYSVSVSHGHDRLDTSDGNSLAYVYLLYDFEYNNSSKLKIEGFVNNNTYPVYLYFTFRDNTWNLVDTEIYQADWSVPTMYPYQP